MNWQNVLLQAQAIFFLPVMATVVIPVLIIFNSGEPSIKWELSTPLNGLATAVCFLLIGIGLVLLLNTIILFARVGEGTLAPWTPTKKLVVSGVYRYVRHPMISSIFFVLLGEALVVKLMGLLNWFFVFLVLNLIYIPLFEEPGLEKRFGEDYRLYEQNVPRWLPRLKPWKP